MSETLKRIESQNAALETSRGKQSWYTVPIDDLISPTNTTNNKCDKILGNAADIHWQEVEYGHFSQSYRL
jgi:hypothetical protein